MKCGIGPIPEELKHLPRLSPTALAELDKSAGHFQAYRNKEFKQTDSMLEGTMIHMACLEPDKFFSMHCSEPLKENFPRCLFTADDIKGELDAMKVEYKSSIKKADLIALIKKHRPDVQIWEEVVESLVSGKVQLKNDLWQACVRLAEEMKLREFESKIWDKCEKEKYLWWVYETADGDQAVISMKPDIYGMDLGPEKNIHFCGDIKKVRSVEDRHINNEVSEGRYWLKAAIYNEGLTRIYQKEFNFFSFIFVTAAPPYEIRNETLNSGHIDNGWQKFEALVEYFFVCHKNNHWPKRFQKVQNYCEQEWEWNKEDRKIEQLKEQTAILKGKFNGNGRSTTDHAAASH